MLRVVDGGWHVTEARSPGVLTIAGLDDQANTGAVCCGSWVGLITSVLLGLACHQGWLGMVEVAVVGMEQRCLKRPDFWL